MKNVTSILFISGFLIASSGISTTVKANEFENNVEAGITPDSFLYSVDQYFEQQKLDGASTTEEKTALLIEFAKERLAEIELLTAEEKTEYISQLLEKYNINIEEVQSIIIEDEESNQEELLEEVAGVIEIGETVGEELNEENAETLKEINDQAYLVANVVKGLDQEKVISLRNEGLGYGQIAQISKLAEVSGKTEEEILLMIQEGKGFGVIKKELNGVKKHKTEEVIVLPPTEDVITVPEEDIIEEVVTTIPEDGTVAPMAQIEENKTAVETKERTTAVVEKPVVKKEHKAANVKKVENQVKKQERKESKEKNNK
jgi:hypothetical protein